MKFLFSILCVLLLNTANSQVVLIIDSLDASQINPIKPENRSEFLYDGPFVALTCVIQNITDSIIQLSPADALIYLQYMYEGEVYSKKIFSVALSNLRNMKINPNENVKFYFFESLFPGTKILQKHKLDYTIEALKVLPTLKVIYKESGFLLKSYEIVNVKVSFN